MMAGPPHSEHGFNKPPEEAHSLPPKLFLPLYVETYIHCTPTESKSLSSVRATHKITTEPLGNMRPGGFPPSLQHDGTRVLPVAESPQMNGEDMTGHYHLQSP